MLAFERAVVKSLLTLPQSCWQRVDGLMTEKLVMELYPTRFPSLRLWLLEKRGVIRSRRTGHFFASQRGMKSYQIADRARARDLVKEAR
jgi:hypothetical protein